MFLPPHSTYFNPIEDALAKLKSMPHKAAARTLDDLWEAIAEAIKAFRPTESASYFAAAGCDAT